MSSQVVARLKRIKIVRRDARRLEASRAQTALNQADSYLNGLVQQQAGLYQAAGATITRAVTESGGHAITMATIEAARMQSEQLHTAAKMMDGRIEKAREFRAARAQDLIAARQAVLAAENAVTRADSLIDRLVHQEVLEEERREEIEIEELALRSKPNTLMSIP